MNWRIWVGIVYCCAFCFCHTKSSIGDKFPNSWSVNCFVRCFYLVFDSLNKNLICEVFSFAKLIASDDTGQNDVVFNAQLSNHLRWKKKLTQLLYHVNAIWATLLPNKWYFLIFARFTSKLTHICQLLSRLVATPISMISR